VTELETARKRIADLEEELAEVSRQLAALTRYVFGKRSEQTPPPAAGQLDPALETEQASPPLPPPAPPDKAKGGSRKGRKTRSDLLPDHLPVEETVLLDPLVAANPGNWREIDREISERLERVPGKLIILRLTRPVYVRRDQPFAPPVCAPVPAQFLPGSFLGPHGGSGPGQISLSPATLPSGQSPGMGKRRQAFRRHPFPNHWQDRRGAGAGGALHGR